MSDHQDQARLTVVGSIYHQRIDEEAFAVEIRYQRLLSDSSRYYQDEVRVEREWVEIPLGRVKSPGLIVVENREGLFVLTQPTTEQQEDMVNRVVEVGVWCEGEITPILTIHPTEQQPMSVHPGADYSIRCRHKGAKCLVTVFPR